MTDVVRRPQSRDDLWEHTRQRLVEEGFSPRRADELATALVDPESRLGALDELEDRIDRLSDVVDLLTTRVEGAADSAEQEQESSIRHPIRAVEHELEHLRDVANEGKSAKTPAIVAGGVLAFLIPLFALVLTLVLGIAYFATRGESDGTLGPTGTGSQGPTATHAGEEAPPPQPSPTQGSATAGPSVFAENCSGCHGVTGHGGNGGPDLSAIPAAKNLQRVIDQVTNGGGGMPPFKGSLTDQQIRVVAAYVTAKVAK